MFGAGLLLGIGLGCSSRGCNCHSCNRYESYQYRSSCGRCTCHQYQSRGCGSCGGCHSCRSPSFSNCSCQNRIY